jgi:hypothetical protein
VRDLDGSAGIGCSIGGGEPIIAPEPAFSILPKRVPFSRFKNWLCRTSRQEEHRVMRKGSYFDVLPHGSDLASSGVNTLPVPGRKSSNSMGFLKIRQGKSFVNLPFYMVIQVNFTKIAREKCVAA